MNLFDSVLYFPVIIQYWRLGNKQCFVYFCIQARYRTCMLNAKTADYGCCVSCDR